MPREYAVFISYRHADNLEMGRKWANWLHEALESYEVPPDLVGKTSLRGDKVPASLYPVFRDEAELPADADLSTNIRRALEHSGLLVVLCSPRAVQSRFVEDEIRYFKELGKSDRILALMIDGEPNASDDPAKVAAFGAEAECFPAPLRFGVPVDGDARKIDWSARTEPIAADVRPGGKCAQGWTTAAAYREELAKDERLTARQINSAVQEYGERLELAKLKVIAGAVGLPLGELTQRDKAHQLVKARRRQRIVLSLAVTFAVISFIALALGIVAQARKQEAEQRRSEAESALARTRQAMASVWEEKAANETGPARLACLTTALRYHPENSAFKKLCFELLNQAHLVPEAAVVPAPALDTALWAPELTEAGTYHATSPSGRWKVTSHLEAGNSGTASPRYIQSLDLFERGNTEPLVIAEMKKEDLEDKAQEEAVGFYGLFAWHPSEQWLCVLGTPTLWVIDLPARKVIAEIDCSELENDEPVRVGFDARNMITVTCRSTDAARHEILLAAYRLSLPVPDPAAATPAAAEFTQEHSFRLSADDAAWQPEVQSWLVCRGGQWHKTRIRKPGNHHWTLNAASEEKLLALGGPVIPLIAGTEYQKISGSRLSASIDEGTGQVSVWKKGVSRAPLVFGLQDYIEQQNLFLDWAGFIEDDAVLMVGARPPGADADHFWLVTTKDGRPLFPVFDDQDFIAKDGSYLFDVYDGRHWKDDFQETAEVFRDLVRRTVSEKLKEDELPIRSIRVTPLGFSLAPGESPPESFLQAVEGMVGLGADLDEPDMGLRPILTVADPFAEGCYLKLHEYEKALTNPEEY